MFWLFKKFSAFEQRPYGILAENYSKSSSKLHSTGREDIFEENLNLEKLYVLLHFVSSFDQKISGLMSKISTPGFRNCLLCVHMSFREICFFHDSFEFSYCFQAVRKNFWHIGSKALKVLSKLHFTCTKDVFGGKLIFEEKKSFVIFFEFWWKTLLTFVKKTSARFQKMHFRPLFSEQNIYFYICFEFWSKTLRISVGKFCAWLQKLLSTLVQRNFLHNIIFFREKGFCFSTEFEGKYLELGEIFWQDGENCSLCVQRRFFDKLLTFSQSLQACYLISDIEVNRPSEIWQI